MVVTKLIKSVNMESANLLNFHPLGCSKSKHGGFISWIFYAWTNIRFTTKV